MRCALILFMLAASLAHAAFNDHVEVRNLDLDGTDLVALDIEAGAGSLEVIGVAGTGRVHVTATIGIADADADEARRLIESRLELTLEQDGDRAVLKSNFDHAWLSFDGNARVDLEVRIPEHLALKIDDGSGSVAVRGVRGGIDLTDGSGSISVIDSGGGMHIEDGSGSIEVRNLSGDLRIDDGSGSIDVRGVAGSVTVDDGSGGIGVSDIAGDLVIEDDGSGGLRHSGIGGVVENRG